MSEHHLPHDHGGIFERDRQAMPDSREFDGAAELFKTLGDSTRLRIFWLLCHCEECVINIAALTDMTSPAVSHHLRLLKTSGLIVSRREGKEMYYKAADTDVAQSLHKIIESIADITCPE